MSESLKYDTGKLRFDLIPAECHKAIAEVLTVGCVKYKENSWQGIEKARYVAALYRHINAWQMGEINDPETGIHHMAHAMVNAMFIMFKDNHNIV